MKDYWTIKDQADKVIYVSRVAADSFGDDQGKVIHNLTDPQDVKKLLILVSASRLSYEKGGQRMLDLARLLEAKKIPYVWYCFTDDRLPDAPPGMVFKTPTLDIKPYIKAADFLVQLSDQESFCYSVVEAWEMGTRTITTPLPVLSELGFEEGKHGYTIPFNVKECENIEKIMYSTKQPFKFRIDNKSIVKHWRETLGNTKPTRKKQPKKGYKWVKALLDLREVQQQRDIKAGEVYQTPAKRAEEGQKQGFWTILN
jgi:hypothetical protein